MRKMVMLCVLVMLCTTAAVAAVGHVPRAVVARLPAVAALEASTGAWMYNAEENLCYPWPGFGLGGFVVVPVCPAGSFRGYLYNTTTFECIQYPQDLSIGYGDPWVWRTACPGPGATPPGCPDPREQSPLDLIGIVKADGFGLHALQSPPGPATPCSPGDLRFTGEGIFLCVGIDAWGKAVLTLP